MADVGRIYTGARAYSNEEYRRRLYSQLYTRAPFGGVVIGKPLTAGMLRPGAFSVSGDAIPRARKKQLAGGYQNNIFFQTGTSSGTANVTARGNVPQVTSPTTDSQDQQRKSAFFKWTKKMTEVICWNITTELSGGQFSLGDAKLESQNIGMQSHFDSTVAELWVGSPSDQTDDRWTEQLGVEYACDDNNTYGGVDRSVAGNAGWRGRRDTTTRAANIGLVDFYHTQNVGSYTTAVLDVGEGFDLVVWNKAVWETVKAEAKSVGINSVRNSSNIPEYAKAGILREGFYFNDTFHTYDPWLKDYSATDSADPDLSTYALFTRAADWCFMTHSDTGYGNMGPWVNIAQYTEAGKDAHRMLISTIYQFWNEAPGNSMWAQSIT